MSKDTFLLAVEDSCLILQVMELFFANPDPSLILLLAGCCGPPESCLVHLALLLAVELTLVLELPSPT